MIATELFDCGPGFILWDDDYFVGGKFSFKNLDTVDMLHLAFKYQDLLLCWANCDVVKIILIMTCELAVEPRNKF